MNNKEKRLRRCIASVKLNKNNSWKNQVIATGKLIHRSEWTIYAWLSPGREIPDALLELLELKLGLKEP